MRSVNKFPVILVFLFIFFSMGKSQSQNIRAASFNIRYDNPKDLMDNWKYRKKVVAGLIKFHDFDVFGSQEGLRNQLLDLEEELKDYSFIGVGRDDGKSKGEHAAIFYRKDKYEVVEKGNFWLSQDPSKPNKGWDAVLPRLCSWAQLKEKKSGFSFFVFNAHFDHVGKVARNESSKLILQKIDQIANGLPTILTGDFNVDQHSESYTILNSDGSLSDTYGLAESRYGATGTFNGFKMDSRTNSRIDHIFVTSHFQVLKHGILTDTYQTDTLNVEEITNSGNHPKEVSFYENKTRFPSDHYPVLTVLKVNK